MNRVVSADWVLPIEGPPIEDGAVAIEAGRIAAVGTSEELGEGTRYDDSVIVPGFVNAHSHLEYAVYGGFGDGLGDFSEWIALHIQRKARIGWDEFVDIAKLGAAECLASGVTTVGDCSFSGATAIACAELGLRATVYIEVFGSDPDARARTLRRDSRPRRATRSPSACAPASLLTLRTRCRSTSTRRVRARLADRDAHLREPFRGRVPPDRRRRVGSYKDLLVDAPGATGTRLLAEHDLLGPNLVAAHCVVLEDDEIGLLAATGTGVAHCPRSNAALGCGVAPLAELRAAGVERRRGYRQPGFGALVRLLRGAQIRGSLREGAGGQA